MNRVSGSSPVQVNQTSHSSGIDEFVPGWSTTNWLAHRANHHKSLYKITTHSNGLTKYPVEVERVSHPKILVCNITFQLVAYSAAGRGLKPASNHGWESSRTTKTISLWNRRIGTILQWEIKNTCIVHRLATAGHHTICKGQMYSQVGSTASRMRDVFKIRTD